MSLINRIESQLHKLSTALKGDAVAATSWFLSSILRITIDMIMASRNWYLNITLTSSKSIMLSVYMLVFKDHEDRLDLYLTYASLVLKARVLTVDISQAKR